MIAQMAPYTPSLYQPDAYGRYRQYPRVVDTPIPGAGYHVGKMLWAEQELNLDGSSKPQNYGSYREVPLRGLGNAGMFARHLFDGGLGQFLTAEQRNIAQFLTSPESLAVMATATAAPVPDEPLEQQYADAAAEVERAAQAILQPPPEDEAGFFSKSVGPVPLWALVGGGVVVAGGAAWWLLRRRR